MHCVGNKSDGSNNSGKLCKCDDDGGADDCNGGCDGDGVGNGEIRRKAEGSQRQMPESEERLSQIDSQTKISQCQMSESVKLL